MKEAFYMGSTTVIVDYSVQFYQSSEDIVASKGFKVFLTRYFKDLAIRDIKLFRWLTNGRPLEEMIPDLITLTKQLLVLNIDEISGYFTGEVNKSKALFVVEDSYNYWRKKQRFSVMKDNSNIAYSSFIEADSKYNQLVIYLYRTCEEKLQGRSNIVYRQLQAGTNASCVVKNYRFETATGYSNLKNVPFINRVMLRTPIIFHPAFNKRTGQFVEVKANPVKSSTINQADWYCMPVKVNDLVCFTFFHKDFMANGLALANLFEIADENICINRKPDLICIYGNQDDKDECSFYHDTANDIWVGNVSYSTQIEYFGYIKKAILTLHNLAKIQQDCLPIHGSMMEIYFHDGTMKSLVLIGDSGAGKSESIEAIKQLSKVESIDNKIDKIDVVFDDMGSMQIINDHVYASGSEIGAFVRLDDLDKDTAYQDMERSIFLSPESANARVILPISNYEFISGKHKIDMVLYANNYEKKIGLRKFNDYNEGKQTFIQGKRMALGTTQEKGLSQTFFANPFGPMQKQAECLQLMERVFNNLFADNVYVGELYTNLGTDQKENIVQSAGELLKVIKEI